MDLGARVYLKLISNDEEWYNKIALCILNRYRKFTANFKANLFLSNSRQPRILNYAVIMDNAKACLH